MKPEVEGKNNDDGCHHGIFPDHFYCSGFSSDILLLGNFFHSTNDLLCRSLYFSPLAFPSPFVINLSQVSGMSSNNISTIFQALTCT